MERPPRQGEERGGRRGSPQALTGGVSAPRLLHAHPARASCARPKIPANCSLVVRRGGEPVQPLSFVVSRRKSPTEWAFARASARAYAYRVGVSERWCTQYCPPP